MSNYAYSSTYRPNVPRWLGMGDSYIVSAGVGQSTTAIVARQIANEIADRVVDIVQRGKMDPEDLEKFTAAVSRGTEPMIRTVVSRDIMPKVIFWGLLGMVGVGALSAFIASQTVKQRVRRNPRRAYSIRSRRRAAA